MKTIGIVLLMLIASVGIMQAQELPIDFESGSFTFSDFGDNVTELGVDPMNPENNVAVTTKTTGAATWAGTTMCPTSGFTTAIPFTETETSISVMVYSPAAGIQVRLKAEDHNDNTLTAETEATVTIANAWQKLVFDFSEVASGTNPFNVTTNFDMLSIFFDFGNEGDDAVYYWDNVFFLAAATADDATLSELLIDGVSVNGFLPTTLNYTEELPYGTTDVPTVSATSYNPEAEVTINDAFTLSDTTSIVVLAEDGITELIYTVSFTESTIPSSDATLKDLKVDGATVSGFSSSVYEYVFSLPGGTTEVPAITATSNNLGANVVINDAESLSDTTYVVVTAQDASTTLTYKVSFAVISTYTLPIDFENGSYGFTDFDGGTAMVISNPNSSGINTSSNVAQIIRDGGATWAGSKLQLDEAIDFSVNNTFSMKVFSIRADVPVLFKLEGENAATELFANTTVANEWETLTWDFTGSASDTYNELVFMFDFGTVGDGSANSTFLFDDVELYDRYDGKEQMDLPVDFESTTVFYEMVDYDGALTELVEDPTDATNTVAKTIREAGTAPWAGTTIGTGLGFASRIPFTESETTVSIRIYSHKAGVPVLLKAEDYKDASKTAETFANTTKSEAWETLVFDFSNVAPGTNPFDLNTYFNKLSLMYNKGVTPTGETFYWDDVVFGGTTAIDLNDDNIIEMYTSNGELFLDLNNSLNNGKIEIFDVTGRKIFSKNNIDNNEQININTKNMVIVRIYNDQNTPLLTKKIVLD